VSAASSAPAPAAPATSTPPTAPVSERTAFAVLGTMIVLILALTFLLIETTRVNPASAAEPPTAADGGSLAQR
jgi:hypothetical protein